MIYVALILILIYIGYLGMNCPIPSKEQLDEWRTPELTDNKENTMTKWYISKTRKQQYVLLFSGVLLSAIPMIGWIFIAPWLVPLMLFMEFKYHGEKI